MGYNADVAQHVDMSQLKMAMTTQCPPVLFYFSHCVLTVLKDQYSIQLPTFLN